LGTNDMNMADMVSKRRANHGATHPKVTLTETDVHAIRASSDTHKVLAERYGICLATVWNVRHGRTWKYLTHNPP
jgi:DNA-binding transcriptional regulator YiaG